MKKIILLVLSVLILIAVIIVFFVLNSSPNKLSQAEKDAALVNLLGRKPILDEKDVPKGDVEYKGKTLAFKYPAAAKMFVTLVNGKEVKDTWHIDYLNFDIDDPRLSMLITVADSPTSVTTIEDYPAVKLRVIQPAMFNKSEIKVDGQSGLVFVKTDNSGFEKTAFVYYKAKIFMFSMQGVDLVSADPIFQRIINSVKFK